jgi:hypothetical protein
MCGHGVHVFSQARQLLLELPGSMQLSPSASSAAASKVQPRYSGGTGVSGNQPPLVMIDIQSINLSELMD